MLSYFTFVVTSFGSSSVVLKTDISNSNSVPVTLETVYVGTICSVESSSTVFCYLGETYVMGGPWMAVMAGAKVLYREWLKTGERMLAMTASSRG